MSGQMEDIPASFWDDVAPYFDYSNPPPMGTKVLMSNDDGTYSVSEYEGRSEGGKFLFKRLWHKIRISDPNSTDRQ